MKDGTFDNDVGPYKHVMTIYCHIINIFCIRNW